MPEMAVRADVGLAARKMHCLHNALDQRLPLQNAAIGAQYKSPRSFVEGNPATMVGIFWLIGDRLILDTSPLSDAEPYGDSLGHRTSHIDYWTAQQCLGTVSRAN
jgi:hypothetical protein